MSRVSVIIPCYNLGAYLDEAVESVLAQDHDDLEIIVVDDGSTDPLTLDVLNQGSWPKTQVLRQSNQGLPQAVNNGIERSSGSYILVLSADDALRPGYISRAAEVLDTRSEVGIVYCRAEYFGDRHGEWVLPPFDRRTMAVENMIFASALYRREDFDAVGGYSRALTTGLEDWDLWIRIIQIPREVLRLDGVYFRYRIRTDSFRAQRHSDDERNAAAHGLVMRNNPEFFLQHSEAIWLRIAAQQRRISELEAQLDRWGPLIDPLERLVRSVPGLRHAARRLRRGRRTLGQH